MPTKVIFPSLTLQLTGELYDPAPRSPPRNGAAIIVSHPMTAVKEQTSTDHATALSIAGFHVLTFDAGYQGESSGLPRGLEDPHQRAEDIKAAVTYLSTLNGKIDPARVGVLGICASGGYASFAAQSDSRIRALATISAACVGRMTRNGGASEETNTERTDVIAATLEVAGQWRTSNPAASSHHATDAAPKMFDATNVSDTADAFTKHAAEYYGTSRGHHDRSDQRVPPMSYDLMVNYDSFGFQHLIAPRPLLMIAGADAETLHWSREAVEKAREPKELFVVTGRDHFDLYDDLSDSGPKLAEFFARWLR